MHRKLSLLLAAMALALSLSCCSGSKNSDLAEGEVYICTGRYSKRYHNNRDCEGLQHCGGSIVKVKTAEAQSAGRTPCGYCFGNR